jgi:hypothetical protein
MNQLGGYVGPTVGLFGDYGGIYYKENGFTNMAPSAFPPAGTGYQHYSIPVGALAKVGGSSLVNPTDNPLCFVIGLYAPGLTYTGTEEIDIANLQITMLTNAAPPPLPTLSVLPTTPELRVFAQNSQETYNQEGFGTVDDNQSWVGSATSTTPVSYSVSFKDFNTVNGFSFYYEMAGYNTVGVNPYLIYDTPNEFQFTITSQSSGFTWSLDYKTNAPLNGVSVNVASGVTTSTTGVGTWTLTFDSDTNGTVTAVDGSVTPFNLGSEEVATNFANPMNICFGIAPNNPAGFGQYIDISKMVITNVAGANEYSDFTTNTVFDTTQWTAGFSLDAGSVIQVATNTPLWVKWQVPDAGFGLETAPSLATNTTWYLPSYWNGVTLNPLRMGTSNVWVLIPTTCMPTLDGGQGENGAGLSPTSFFKLQNPPTAQ